MPGGIMDLVAVGAQDNYLINNPQITFFKNVHKNYTNFSMEMIKLDPKVSSNLKQTSETKLEFKIDRNADLIKQVYFVFDLPAIYSQDVTYQGYKFNWIDRIGEYIIKDVVLEIGGQEIDKHYGEWLHIWSELTLGEAKKDGYNRMIGNTSDMFNPLNSSDAYPVFSDTGTLRPVIRGRKVIVPLPFWFTYMTGTELPLISLQGHEVIIKFTLRSFESLYTVIDSSIRKAPPSTTYNLGQFFKSPSTITELDISPNLEVNYIFLDTEERKAFADKEHEYIINKVDMRREIITPTTNVDTTTIKLDFNNPVSNLIWKLRRSDFESSNQYFNFTNWFHKDINPLINSEHNAFAAEETIDVANIASYLEKDILKSAKLIFNGSDRFQTKTAPMFNLVNNYQHMEKVPEDGIYVYSFNLKNNVEEYQQTGSLNFSRFNKVDLQLTTTPKSDANYTYNVMIFIIQLNVFRIASGMGSLQFAN